MPGRRAALVPGIVTALTAAGAAPATRIDVGVTPWEPGAGEYGRRSRGAFTP